LRERLRLGKKETKNEPETIEMTTGIREIDEAYAELKLPELKKMNEDCEQYSASVSEAQVFDAISLLDRMMTNLDRGYFSWRLFIDKKATSAIRRQISTNSGFIDLTDLEQISLLTSGILLQYDAIGDYIQHLLSQLSLISKNEKIAEYVTYIETYGKSFKNIQDNLQIALDQLISMLELNSDTKVYLSTEKLLKLTKYLLYFTIGVLGLTALGILFGVIHF